MTKKSERQPIKAENVAGGAGYILKEELIKGEQLGADAQLSKPEIGQLVAAIDKLVGNE